MEALQASGRFGFPYDQFGEGHFVCVLSRGGKFQTVACSVSGGLSDGQQGCRPPF